MWCAQLGRYPWCQAWHHHKIAWWTVLNVKYGVRIFPANETWARNPNDNTLHIHGASCYHLGATPAGNMPFFQAEGYIWGMWWIILDPASFFNMIAVQAKLQTWLNTLMMDTCCKPELLCSCSAKGNHHSPAHVVFNLVAISWCHHEAARSCPWLLEKSPES